MAEVTTTPSVEAANVAELREALHPACRVENCRIEKLIADFEQAIASAARAEAEQRAARLETAGNTLAVVARKRADEIHAEYDDDDEVESCSSDRCQETADAIDAWQAAKGGEAGTEKPRT